MKFRSLKYRMMMYSTIMVVVVVTVLATILLYYLDKNVWEEFELRGTFLSQALANDMQLSVMIENKADIKELLNRRLKIYPDVVSIVVFNAMGKQLVKRSNEVNLDSKYLQVFEAPIDIESGVILDDDDLVQHKTGEIENIGRVKIIFSTRRINIGMMKMVILVFVFTVIVMLLRIASDFFFIRRITDPIKELVIGSEAVANGDLSQRLDVTSGDEVGKLSLSFNNMIVALKERDIQIKDRQQQIEENVKKINTSLKEKELLLKEIHHRVKNNMQLVCSLLRLQIRYIKDQNDKEIFKDCISRMRSMALIHEKLYKTTAIEHINFTRYVKDLSHELFRSYISTSRVIDLKIEIEEKLFLGLDTAIPCGLIINELVSNSLKYGFVNRDKGLIKIILKTIENDHFEMEVRDDGVGIPKDLDLHNTGTLGLELVFTLITQIGGVLELVREGGTVFNIKFKELNYKKRF